MRRSRLAVVLALVPVAGALIQHPRAPEVHTIATIGHTSEEGWVAPVPGGREVLVSVDSSLLLVERATGRVRRLATGRFTQPALSPTGTHLAFRRWLGDSTHVFIAGVDLHAARLGQVRLLVPGRAHSPLFSPDGRFVAYARGLVGAESLAVVALDGTGSRTLKAGGVWGMMPSGWSPDGRAIYFTVRARNADLMAPFQRVGLGSSGSEILIRNNFLARARVSADGKHVVYMPTSDSFAIARTDGTPVTRLPAFQENNGIIVSEPEWVSGTSSLVFTSRFQPRALVSYPFDGGAPLRLTDSTAYAESPAVSPDGRWIAAVTATGGRARISVLPASGGQVRQFEIPHAIAASNQHVMPKWSPDSKLIAVPTGNFSAPGHPVETGFDILDPSSGKVTTLNAVHGAIGRYAWSPDGRSIRYIFAQFDSEAVRLGVNLVREAGLDGSDRLVHTLYRCCAAFLMPAYDVVYVRDDGTHLNLATGARRTVIDSVELPVSTQVKPLPVFTRDGKWFGMATSATGRGRYNRILLISMETGERRMLDPGLQSIPPGAVEFVPDSKRVFAIGPDSSGVGRVVVMSLAGTERRVIGEVEMDRIGFTHFGLMPDASAIIISRMMQTQPLKLLELRGVVP